VSNTSESDSDDDCNLCPKVSNLHLVRLKSLFNRLGKYNNKLSIVSKLNLELEEKYQEISNSITTLIEMNKELNPNGEYPNICYIIAIIALPFFTVWDEVLMPIWDKIDEYSLLGRLIFPLLIFYDMVLIFFTILILGFHCIEWPW